MHENDRADVLLCTCGNKISESAKTWIVIGNNDGFEVVVNGEKVLKRDEIRLWTPYNNYALIDLKKGENEFIYKLLRRTEQLKFAVGLRIYRRTLA